MTFSASADLAAAPWWRLHMASWRVCDSVSLPSVPTILFVLQKVQTHAQTQLGHRRTHPLATAHGRQHAKALKHTAEKT
jgi:hypothetical protein